MLRLTVIVIINGSNDVEGFAAEVCQLAVLLIRMNGLNVLLSHRAQAFLLRSGHLHIFESTHPTLVSHDTILEIAGKEASPQI